MVSSLNFFSVGGGDFFICIPQTSILMNNDVTCCQHVIMRGGIIFNARVTANHLRKGYYTLKYKEVLIV